MRNRPRLWPSPHCALLPPPLQLEPRSSRGSWDVGAHVIVEGVEVVLTESTRIERKGHPGITSRELRIGWEVEVQGRRDGDRLVAEKIKVETERHKKVDLEGYVDSLGEDSFDVDGRPVRYSGVD